jgi:TolB-like protein/DNA-binding winged helix-turn-helix (wHTH) protein/Tfp pilus assembly protein PilF
MFIFEHFKICVAERTVLVDGAPAVLGARAFDVLLALAQRSDRVVSKAELLDLVWPGLVVEENNLTVQISTLRRVLGHSTILTITGRGYRVSGSPKVVPESPRTHQQTAALPRLERRLVTIVQADIVNWHRLVARDLGLATNEWKHVRVEFVERTAQRFGGRPTELTPERIQLEFASAVEAVTWSLELQGLLAERRRLAAKANDIQLLDMRIAIVADDIIVDDGKLVGDGVNVAADLLLCAQHDEILTTQFVCELVSHKLGARFESLGERLMRRLQRPMQVFRVCTADKSFVATLPRDMAASRRLASVAVLPFVSDGPADETYFGDGVTEEIIGTLSLNRALFVIQHPSMARYRSRIEDLAGAAEELGVRYLVTGSVRRGRQRVRIHASLNSIHHQRILWQDAFDGTTEDLFGLQSEIAAKVAASVAPQVQDEEVALVRRRPTESYDAYDCVLRALAGIYQLGSAEFDMAGSMLKRSIELDPTYAQAHAHLAWWYSVRQGERRTPYSGEDGRLALDHALQAIRLDSRDAWALSVAGYMLVLQKKRHAQALEMFEEALAINPSCAAAWARCAATLSYIGRWEDSLEHVQRAISLSPFDQHMFWHLTIRGAACFVGGRYDEAAAWLGKALRLNPRFNGARRVQIAALVRTGEIAEARELAQEILTDCPEFSVEEFGRWSPMRQPYLDDLLRGLREAGLPD